MTQGPSQGNEGQKKQYDLSVLIPGLLKSGKLTWQNPFLLILFGFLSLGEKDAPFLQVQGWHLSCDGLINCFRGTGRGEVRETFLPLIFSPIFHHKIFSWYVLNPTRKGGYEWEQEERREEDQKEDKKEKRREEKSLSLMRGADSIHLAHRPEVKERREMKISTH